MKESIPSLMWTVEVPILPSRASARRLPENVCYALVGDLRERVGWNRDLALRLGAWMQACVREGEMLYGWPLLPLVSDRSLDEFVASRRDAIKTDRDVIATCESAEAVAGVLLEVRSERTVFFIGHDESLIADTLRLLDEPDTHYATFEEVLLRRMDRYGGLFFAAEGHASLEVFGTHAFFQHRCLPALLSLDS